MILTQKQMVEIKKTVEFGSTNKPWNDSTCHRPHRIGSMTKIFEGQKLETLSEFVRFYFRSGEERLELIKKNEGKETSFINYSYGRTKSELWVLAHTFRSYIVKNTENPFNLTVEDCYIHMMIRIFLESFKGMEKEREILEQLQDSMAGYPIIKTTSTIDTQYAVDGEVFHHGLRVCGIQVKPITYIGNYESKVKTREMNSRRNNEYTKIYGIPVFYCYYDKNGLFINLTETVDNIIYLGQEMDYYNIDETYFSLKSDIS